jgi:hypothetical protein
MTLHDLLVTFIVLVVAFGSMLVAMILLLARFCEWMEER